MKTSWRHIFKTFSRRFYKTSSRHVFKTTPRHVLKMSWRCLQRNYFSCYKTSSIYLQNILLDFFKTSSRYLCEMSSRPLQDVLKTSLERKNCYTEDVLKTSSRHVLKASSRCFEDQQMFPGIWSTMECLNIIYSSLGIFELLLFTRCSFSINTPTKMKTFNQIHFSWNLREPIHHTKWGWGRK